MFFRRALGKRGKKEGEQDGKLPHMSIEKKKQLVSNGPAQRKGKGVKMLVEFVRGGEGKVNTTKTEIYKQTGKKTKEKEKKKQHPDKQK